LEGSLMAEYDVWSDMSEDLRRRSFAGAKRDLGIDSPAGPDLQTARGIGDMPHIKEAARIAGEEADPWEKAVSGRAVKALGLEDILKEDPEQKRRMIDIMRYQKHMEHGDVFGGRGAPRNMMDFLRRQRMLQKDI
jgi:hypothetical protein